jgi:hypothetical protein
MKMPKFEPWVHWDQRCNVKDCHRPGVYLLRQFDGTPPTKVDPLEAPLIYVGETRRTLVERWTEFHDRVYRDGARKHSGGTTFAGLFCGNKEVPVHPWLYVACHPVDKVQPHVSAYIPFLERWIIWEHVQKFGKLPQCNKE